MSHSKIPHAVRVTLTYDPVDGWNLQPAYMDADDSAQLCLYCMIYALPRSLSEWATAVEENPDLLVAEVEHNGHGTFEIGEDGALLLPLNTLFGEIRPHRPVEG